MIFYAQSTGILDADKIDKNDETYKAWTTDESISMQEYLDYAISADGWMFQDLMWTSEYMDITGNQQCLADFIEEQLSEDDTFSRKYINTMIMEGSFSGAECVFCFMTGECWSRMMKVTISCLPVVWRL